MKSYFVLGTLLGSLNLTVALAASDPEEVVRTFYGWALVEYTWGIPSISDSEKLQGILAPELIHFFQETSQLEYKCGKLFPPDMKHPVWEANIFSSEYEGASEIIVARSESSDNQATVQVELIYILDDLPKGSARRVRKNSIEVALRLSEGTWVITDFRYSDGRSLNATISGHAKKLKSCINDW